MTEGHIRLNIVVLPNHHGDHNSLSNLMTTEDNYGL